MKVTVSVTALILIWTSSVCSNRILPRPKVRSGAQKKFIRFGDKDSHPIQEEIFEEGEVMDTPYRRDSRSYHVINVFPKLMDNDLTERYGSLFDKDGKIYLSKPKPSKDRDFNELMNKVLLYKLGSKRPLSQVFSEQEIASLQTIAKAIPNEKASPKVVSNRIPKFYKFSDLVV